MGFMDKLKDAGKGALKGALTMAATPYGVVTAGKHKMCKVSMNSSHDKLIFIKVAAIEAEYDIRESIKTCSVDCLDNDADLFEVKIVFTDGEESKIHLNVLLDRDKALDVRYKTASDFVCALGLHIDDISDESKSWINKICLYAKMPTIF